MSTIKTYYRTIHETQAMKFTSKIFDWPLVFNFIAFIVSSQNQFYICSVHISYCFLQYIPQVFRSLRLALILCKVKNIQHIFNVSNLLVNGFLNIIKNRMEFRANMQ